MPKWVLPDRNTWVHSLRYYFFWYNLINDPIRSIRKKLFFYYLGLLLAGTTLAEDQPEMTAFVPSCFVCECEIEDHWCMPKHQ